MDVNVVQGTEGAFARWVRKPYAPSARHIPELNGLRVLLVFIVSWYHFWQQSWLTPHVGSVSLDFLVRSGYMPVDGTILLSGFLLFLPQEEHLQRHYTLLHSAFQVYAKSHPRF